MQKLRELVNAKNQVYKTSDYINEDTQQQNAYNNAIANGEAIISGSQNPTMDKSKLNKPLIKLTLLKIYMVPLNFKMIKMLLINNCSIRIFK